MGMHTATWCNWDDMTSWAALVVCGAAEAASRLPFPRSQRPLSSLEGVEVSRVCTGITSSSPRSLASSQSQTTKEKVVHSILISLSPSSVSALMRMRVTSPTTWKPAGPSSCVRRCKTFVVVPGLSRHACRVGPFNNDPFPSRTGTASPDVEGWVRGGGECVYTSSLAASYAVCIQERRKLRLVILPRWWSYTREKRWRAYWLETLPPSDAFKRMQLFRLLFYSLTPLLAHEIANDTHHTESCCYKKARLLFGFTCLSPISSSDLVGGPYRIVRSDDYTRRPISG